MNRMLLLPVLVLGLGLASIAPGCSDDGTSSSTENASSSQSSATGTGSSSATGGEGGFSNPTGGGNNGAGGEGGTAEPMCAGGTPGCGQCAADNCCKEATDCGTDSECLNGTICIYNCNEKFESCVAKCKPMQSNAPYDAYTACLVAKCNNVCP